MKGRNPALLKRNYPKLVISRQSNEKKRESNTKENSPVIMVRMLSATGSLIKKQNSPLKESRKEGGNRFRKTSVSYSKHQQSLLKQAIPQLTNGFKKESGDAVGEVELHELTQKIMLSLTRTGLMMHKEKMVILNHEDLHFILKFLIQDNIFQEVKANRLIQAIKEHLKGSCLFDQEIFFNQRIQNRQKILSLVSLISIKQQIIMNQPFKAKDCISSAYQTNRKMPSGTQTSIEPDTKISPPLQSKTLVETAMMTEPQTSSQQCQPNPQWPGKKAIQLQERSIFDLMSTGNLQEFKDNHKQLMQTCIKNKENVRIKQTYWNHKKIKEEMHNYALFLKDNRYAISSYSPSLTIPAIEKDIARCIQQVQDRLREGQDLNFEQRYLILKDFTEEVRNHYDSTLNEMIKTIQTKTQFCHQFVSKVYKWYENYQSRRELISKQKEEYSEQLFHIYQHLHQLYLRAKEVPSLADKAEELTFSIVERVKKIDEIFIIGNNFY